jgi:hypothetical protein
MALGLTQPVTEMSTRNISWGVKAADEYGCHPCHLMCRFSWNLVTSTSWNLQALSRHVMGLLYLYVYLDAKCAFVAVSWCEGNMRMLTVVTVMWCSAETHWSTVCVCCSEVMPGEHAYVDTRYSYVMEWRDKLIDSNLFHSMSHHNPKWAVEQLNINTVRIIIGYSMWQFKQAAHIVVLCSYFT